MHSQVRNFYIIYTQKVISLQESRKLFLYVHYTLDRASVFMMLARFFKIARLDGYHGGWKSLSI